MKTQITIVECTRTNNTANGNPCFRILDRQGRTYRTEPDSGSVYTVVEGRTGDVTAHLNDNGRITQIDY